MRKGFKSPQSLWDGFGQGGRPEAAGGEVHHQGVGMLTGRGFGAPDYELNMFNRLIKTPLP